MNQGQKTQLDSLNTLECTLEQMKNHAAVKELVEGYAQMCPTNLATVLKEDVLNRFKVGAPHKAYYDHVYINHTISRDDCGYGVSLKSSNGGGWDWWSTDSGWQEHMESHSIGRELGNPGGKECQVAAGKEAGKIFHKPYDPRR